MTIAIRGLCPLLQVFDMPTSLRFYRDVLGFAEVQKSGPGDEVHWAWLRHGDADVMLNTAYDEGERPPTPAASRVAGHADTCLFMGCEDLEGAYAYLVAQGVSAQPPKVSPYRMRQLYATDPDGYGLCFQWPAEQASQRREPVEANDAAAEQRVEVDEAEHNGASQPDSNVRRAPVR